MKIKDNLKTKLLVNRLKAKLNQKNKKNITCTGKKRLFPENENDPAENVSSKNLRLMKGELDFPEIEKISLKFLKNREEIECFLDNPTYDGKYIDITATENKKIRDQILLDHNRNPDITILNSFYQTNNQVLPYSWFFFIINSRTKESFLTVFTIDHIIELENTYQVCLDSTTRNLTPVQMHHLNDKISQSQGY